MRKIKCDECKTIHGGFHLCVDISKAPWLRGGGAAADPKIVEIGKGRHESARRHQEQLTAERWSRNADRDQKIFENRKSGMKLTDAGAEFGLSMSQVSRIVSRMKENHA